MRAKSARWVITKNRIHQRRYADGKRRGTLEATHYLVCAYTQGVARIHDNTGKPLTFGKKKRKCTDEELRLVSVMEALTGLFPSKNLLGGKEAKEKNGGFERQVTEKLIIRRVKLPRRAPRSSGHN